MYTPAKELILSKVAELNARLKPLRTPPPPLEILTGADNVFEPDILNKSNRRTALFLAHPLTLPGKGQGQGARRKTPWPLHPALCPAPLTKQTQLTQWTQQTRQNAINAKNAFRYILLELTDYFLFLRSKTSYANSAKKNIVPVLSHPERIAMIQRNYKTPS
jgi:tyrosine-protein phosphatase YwqE